MINYSDAKSKQIVVINCIESKSFKVNNWNIQVECTKTKKVLTKLYPNRMMVLYIIGHASLTTASIERLKKMGVPIVIMKPNFRTVFFYAPLAEGNFLLRKKQYTISNPLEVAKHIMYNKVHNQYSVLKAIRSKDEVLNSNIAKLKDICDNIYYSTDNEMLMGFEGVSAKIYFNQLFAKLNWEKRMPRVKIDELNACLDIGYSILFNYIEANVKLFGFDPYMGVCHKLWFERKSLICDLIEPFRVIVDKQIIKSFNLGEFDKDDFELKNNQYFLKKGCSTKYTNVFFKVILNNKNQIFLYIRDYYRCFMGKKSVQSYPNFYIN